VRPRRRSPRLEAALGVLAGVIAVELGLRPFTTPMQNEWRTVPLSADSDAAPTEVRYYHEGIAVSHYSSAHARLTGNPRIDGAPTGLILGDSYVEALQVSDEQTLGSIVERDARGAGHPLNVRQYGWPGESLARYADAAPELLARWHPSWVAVLVNRGDFPLAPVATCDGEAPAAPAAAAAAPARARGGVAAMLLQPARTALRESRLGYELSKRAIELTSTRTINRGALMPCPALRRLRAAYGDRLVLVYVATVIPADDLTPHPSEAAFLSVCRSEGLACVSTRGRMVEEHRLAQQFMRGFANTSPNEGHPNAFGHRVIGEELWRTVQRQQAATLMASGGGH
jgi:hypothetical protein